MEDRNLGTPEEELHETKQLSTEENIKLEEERKVLLENVLSGNIKTLKEKVGYVLNRYRDTRNSDVELAWQYWTTFQSKIFNGATITKAQLHALTRIGSLSRSSAKIQNEYKLFEADPQVKKYRGILHEEKRSEAIEDKPSCLPSYTVFIDKTGKNQDHLCVGSL
jgi:hypothetical protein